MRGKFFLLAPVMSVGAVSVVQAADTMMVAEPEPVEYVRACAIEDEVGYFFIPGTDTCLKIGGYYRYEVTSIGDSDFGGAQYGDNVDGYRKRARFAPEFTTRTETELGTLTGYTRLFAQWDTLAGGGTENSTFVDHMQISLKSGPGTFLVGYGDTPYSRFLDYAGPTIFEGRYGFNSAGEISYTYDNDNGLTAIIAAVENDETSDWKANLEGGTNFGGDWGSIGTMGGYDGVAENWGAKVGLRLAVPDSILRFTLDGLYSSDAGGDAGDYSIISPNDTIAEWSVLAGAAIPLGEKVSVTATAQWFSDNDALGADDEYEFSLATPFQPVTDLSITPEVAYDTFSEEYTGILRFQRDF